MTHILPLDRAGATGPIALHREDRPFPDMIIDANRAGAGDGRWPIVYVIEADPSVRADVARIVGRMGWRCEAFAAVELFLALDEETEESCLVLDADLVKRERLCDQETAPLTHRETPVIFLSSGADVDEAVRAMREGAIDFLTKPFRDEALLAALHRGLDCSRSVRREARTLKILSSRYACLSARERQVIPLVASGLLNKQIAFALGISEITVKAHRGQVMRKMEARSLADLVIMSRTLGLAWHGDGESRSNGADARISSLLLRTN